MRRITFSVPTTGSNGSATGLVRLPLVGIVWQIYIAYTGQPATTDVTVFEQVDSNEDNILTVTNSNTNTGYLVRPQAKDSAGAAITGVYDLRAVAGEVVVSVTGGDSGGTVKVTLWLLED